MVVVLILSITLVATAKPDNASQTCIANGNYGLDHGTCVVCVTQGGGAVCICMVLKDLDLLDAWGFKNQGQCIKALK